MPQSRTWILSQDAILGEMPTRSKCFRVGRIDENAR